MKVIAVENYGRFFNKPAEGKVAAKCAKLVLRGLWRIGPGDTIILPPTEGIEELLDYHASIMGFRVKPLYLDHMPGSPFDFVAEIRRSPRLCREITELGRQGYKLGPLMQHASVCKLGNELGLEVLGTPEDLVKAGLPQRSNDKQRFTLYCDEHGLPLPNAPTAITDRKQIFDRARKELARAVRAVLREIVSAGGLGNALCATEAELRKAIAKIADPVAVLVEPHLYDLYQGLKAISVVMEIMDAGPKIVATTLRRLNGLESVGCTVPCPAIPGLEQVIEEALAYGWHLHEMGYRGDADVDAALGERVRFYFESNARVLLTSVILNILEQLAKLWETNKSQLFAEYDEDPPIKGKVFSASELNALAEQAERRVQEETDCAKVKIIIVSPPDPELKGWFSFAVVATSQIAASAARDEFRTLINN